MDGLGSEARAAMLRDRPPPADSDIVALSVTQARQPPTHSLASSY